MAKCPPISKRTKALCRSFLFASQKDNISNEKLTVNLASAVRQINSTSTKVDDLERTEVNVTPSVVYRQAAGTWRAKWIMNFTVRR